MPSRRKEVTDIRQIVVQMRAGRSNRQIATGLKLSRNTVKRYRMWAEQQQLLSGELPELGELQELLEETMAGSDPPTQKSSVEPYREVVDHLRPRFDTTINRSF